MKALRTKQSASDFGTFLRARRERAHLSLEDVARRVNLDPATLGQVEAGSAAPPSAGRLVALVMALSLNPDDAQTLLDLAYLAQQSAPGAAGTRALERLARPAAPVGALSHRRAPEETTPAEAPAHPKRPGANTLVRGLRARGLAERA